MIAALSGSFLFGVPIRVDPHLSPTDGEGCCVLRTRTEEGASPQPDVAASRFAEDLGAYLSVDELALPAALQRGHRSSASRRSAAEG